MINLYDKFETDFTHNGLTILNDCRSCFIVKELNGAYYLELEHPIDERGKYKNLQGWNIIKADGQLFRIPVQTNIQNNGLSVSVTANHIFYDLLNDYNEDTRADSKNVQDALQIALAVNSKFSVGSCDDLGLNTAYFIGENPVKSIYDKILPRWGGELNRDNFQVSIKTRLGADRGVLISYGKNILGFEQTLDWTNVATKIKPIGKDGLTIDLVNQGSKYLISPRVNNYPFVITKEVKFEDIEDATELKNTTLALWGTIDLPSCNYKVNFADLSKTKEYELIKQLITLNLGDTVTIRHKIFNVDISARVIKIKKNVLTDKIEELELGQFKENLSNVFNKIDNQIKYTQQSLLETKDDLVETKTKVFQNDEQISLQATSIDALSDRVSEAELKITADAITSTVRSSTAYINDLGEKITEEEASTIAQTASNVKIGFNNISDIVDIDESGLKVSHGETDYTHMGSDGFKRHVGSTDKDYHYLTYIGTTVVNINGNITVQLPDEFKGKDFKAIASIESMENNSAYYVSKTFKVDVVGYDYENAMVTFYGYNRAIDIRNGSTYVEIDLRITFIVIA